MRSVTDFIEKLRGQYGGTFDFEQVCKDFNIIVHLTQLPDDDRGFTRSTQNFIVIALNERLPFPELKDTAMHELWHALRWGISNPKEEKKADLFAALMRAPNVREGDDIESLKERYNVSYRLAKIRIEYELKKIST